MTGTHLLYPLDDHQLSLLEAVRYDNVPALLDTGRHASQLDLLGIVDHEDVTAGLIELDSGLWNHQRRFRRTPVHRDAYDPTGDQKTIRVRNLRAHRHRVRSGIHLDI